MSSTTESHSQSQFWPFWTIIFVKQLKKLDFCLFDNLSQTKWCQWRDGWRKVTQTFSEKIFEHTLFIALFSNKLLVNKCVVRSRKLWTLNLVNNFLPNKLRLEGKKWITFFFKNFMQWQRDSCRSRLSDKKSSG